MSIRRETLRATMAALAAIVLACTTPASDEADNGGANAQIPVDPGAAAADRIVADWVAAERVPGAVLLVSRGGEVVFERAHGYAQLHAYGAGQYGASAAEESRPGAIRRLDDPVSMRTDTVFDLASVTKVMATTLAVMALVDDGRVALDAPLASYLPDFTAGTHNGAGTLQAGSPAAPGSDAAASAQAAGKRQITVEQLLTHRSGLHQWKPIYYHAADADAAYSYIRELELGWPVGSGRHYSDLGFMLLGRMVAHVAGKPLGELLHERFFGPLGLTDTGFRPRRGPGALSTAGPFAATSHGNPYEHRMVHDADFGYRIEDVDPASWDGWRRYTLVGEVNDGNAFHAFGGEAGHAGLFSTARDLHVLLQMLLNGGEYGGRRYLSKAVIDEFLADRSDGQALGWLLPDHLPAGSFHHPGFTGAYVAAIPAENTAVVLLTNRQNLGVDGEGRYADIGELQRAVTLAVVR